MSVLGDKLRDMIVGKEFRRMTARVQHFESVFDALTNSLGTNLPAYRGNTYTTDVAMSAALARAYAGNSPWGVQLVRTCIDIRAAFTGGAGVEAVLSEEAEGSGEKELAFAREFLNYNKMDDDSVIMDWATDGCIDGRALLILDVKDDNGKKVRARFVPWGELGYTVTADENDYTVYTKVEYTTKKEGGRPVEVAEEKFVYVKFGGRRCNTNTSPPLIGTVLPQMEAYDKALRDMREINNLYATPTPTISLKDGSTVRDVYNSLTGSGENAINWKIGKLLVIGDGTFSMVSADNAGAESIEKEIVLNLKTISAVTGIPVHFLGFSDLMSNRATADGLTEMIYASTSKERNAWLSFYTQAMRKAMVLYNKTASTKLNPNNIKAQLPQNTETKLKALVDLWLPIYEARGITRKTFIDQIPGINSEKESEAVKKEMDDGAYDGVPLKEGNSLRGRNKPGTTSHDPDNVAEKGRLERRTSGQGRNAN